jgi:hypothetical protein
MVTKDEPPFIKEYMGDEWEVQQLVEPNEDDEYEEGEDCEPYYSWIATVETERLADILIEGLTKPRRRQ